MSTCFLWIFGALCQNLSVAHRVGMLAVASNALSPRTASTLTEGDMNRSRDNDLTGIIPVQ